MKKQLFLIFLLIFSPINIFAEESGGIDEQRTKEVERQSGIGFVDVNETLISDRNVLSNEDSSFDELNNAKNGTNEFAVLSDSPYIRMIVFTVKFIVSAYFLSRSGLL